MSAQIDFKKSLETLFPELKESEDERIRKDIIWCLKHSGISPDRPISPYVNTIIKDAIAWLEKQGEQKPTIDKVEPKFKVSDWITDGYLHCKITDVLDDRYIVDTKFAKRSAILFDYESRYHLWTIQDAKDGDVLSYRDGQWIFIYKGIVTEDTFKYYALLSEKGITVNDAAFSLLTSCIIPATKEQRDLLFQKMKEAGYEWDAEKKELKKIEQKPVEWGEEEKTRLMKKCVHRAYQQGYDTGFLMATTELEHNSTWSEAFIKKAEEWLRNNQQGFILTDKDITDFVNYLKGE